MSPFFIFAIVFTMALMAYYIVMIALDLRKLGKTPSTHQEEFDVSSMKEEEEANAVDESQYQLPDTTEEEKKEEIKPEPQVQTVVIPAEDKTLKTLQKLQEVEEKQKVLNTHTSFEPDVDDFYVAVTNGWFGKGKFAKPKIKPSCSV